VHPEIYVYRLGQYEQLYRLHRSSTAISTNDNLSDITAFFEKPVLRPAKSNVIACKKENEHLLWNNKPINKLIGIVYCN
jgi:hypothetical protein